MPGEGGCQARSQLRWGGTPALLAPYTGIPIIVRKLFDDSEADEVNRHSNTHLARGHVNALKAIQDNCGLVTNNLGTGKGNSVLELIEAFERVDG